MPVIWLTGLPSSGKTTLAELIYSGLRELGRRCEVIDGDELRKTVCGDLGFSRKDRLENARRAALISGFLVSKNIIPIVAMVSPYRESRALARALVGEMFMEVYLQCPLEVCMKRDRKGLYSRAANGGLKGLTGFNAEYEAPTMPELVIRTDTEGPLESAYRVFQFLDGAGYIGEKRRRRAGQGPLPLTQSLPHYRRSNRPE